MDIRLVIAESIALIIGDLQDILDRLIRVHQEILDIDVTN